MMAVFWRRHNQLNFGLYYEEMYVCLRTFCNRYFFLLCALGTPWANHRVAFPEKVRQWRNTAIPWKASSARQLYETVIKVWKLHALAKLVGGAKYCICMKNKTIFTQSGLICTKNRFLLKQTLTTFDLPRKQIQKQIYGSQSSWDKTLTPSLQQKTVLKTIQKFL